MTEQRNIQKLPLNSTPEAMDMEASATNVMNISNLGKVSAP